MATTSGLNQRRKPSEVRSSWEDLPGKESTTPSSSNSRSARPQEEKPKKPKNEAQTKNNEAGNAVSSTDTASSTDNSDEPKRFSKIEPSDETPAHPPGYNKKKRDVVKLILVIVAAALLRGDPKVATVLSIVAVVCLHDGKLFSIKNLKWLGLCILSFAMSLASWSLERASEEVDEEKAYTLNSVLWSSAKIVQFCWGMTLSVFLVSAYVHGHNSLLEFDYLWDHEPPPSGPRRDPPPKRYMLY